MSKYGQLLQHPLWQRKRLEIMSRDGFTCVACGRNDKTLHVHHISYTSKPWESPLSEMQTLCNRCHGMLPKHPMGGVFFERALQPDYGDTLFLSYKHCPVCGETTPACHSGCVIFKCGHDTGWFNEPLSDRLMGVQSLSPSGFESQWYYAEEVISL